MKTPNTTNTPILKTNKGIQLVIFVINTNKNFDTLAV